MADPAAPIESTTIVTAPATPTKLMALTVSAQPIAVLILAGGGALAAVLIAIGAVWGKVDAQTVLSVLSTYFAVLGAVGRVSPVAERSTPQRATDVTTTTTGPTVTTTTPGGAP